MWVFDVAAKVSHSRHQFARTDAHDIIIIIITDDYATVVDAVTAAS